MSVWSVRALEPLGALTIFAGTAATAAGPHAGGSPGQRIHRLHFEGTDTMRWVIHRHATIAALFGVAVIGVWLLRRRRGASQDALEPLTVLGVLLAGQGLVGFGPVRAPAPHRHRLGPRRPRHVHLAGDPVGRRLGRLARARPGSGTEEAPSQAPAAGRAAVRTGASSRCCTPTPPAPALRRLRPPSRATPTPPPQLRPPSARRSRHPTVSR